MDAGIQDKDGHIFVMSREDDVINIAGHRISTSALEEVVLSHSLVTDAAVVGISDSLKGQLPLALCVLSSEAKISEEQIRKELIKMVRDAIGPVAAFKLVITVPALPRTRSGKTPRKTISDLAQNKSVRVQY